jgi:predicted nucleic acid-binding protein
LIQTSPALFSSGTLNSRRAISDSLLCSTWAAVRNESTQKGHPISSADAWIAATALVLSAPLVTNNLKDYRHLDKLQIISAAAE